MQDITVTRLAEAIRQDAHPLTGTAQDYDPLMDLIGNAHFVLLGEATHGTHEFYQARAQITRRLIREKGFTAVAVEADWPDAYRVNRYVRGIDDDEEAVDALGGFRRFPAWMWRNADVLDFVGWLREYNDGLPADGKKAGFYGLDLYSLYSSIEAVINYLDKVDPEAAKRARHRYSCFEHFAEDPQVYGYVASVSKPDSCEDEVIKELVDLQSRAAQYAHLDGQLAEDEYFYAVQNARVARDAEEYYRTMYRGGISSWNLRDSHMAGTLSALAQHLAKQGEQPRIVVWEHNSHVGDARATDMLRRGELNVGQLVRQQYGEDTVLVGFSTHRGTVTAASDWGEPAERKRVRPALPGSYEGLFHDARIPGFLLTLRGGGRVAEALSQERLERAIGVIYLPQTERLSHYFYADMSDQFDAVIHFDDTRAVEPLERTSLWIKGEEPETFPFAV